MLIWIASYPRSGNTFLRHVLTQTYGFATYEKYFWGVGHTPLDLDGFRQLEPSRTEMSDGDGLYFIKTHDLPDDGNPAIYLVRDGRDALVSHAHFTIEYDLKVADPTSALFHDTLRSLIEKDDLFGGWSGNVRAWTGRSGSTAVVKFEDLIFAPLSNIRRAMREIGLRSPEIHTSGFLTFDELHRKYPKFFRKGQVGAWREEMPRDLHELFWQRHGATMRRLGYRRPVLRLLWWSVRAWFQSLHAK